MCADTASLTPKSAPAAIAHTLLSATQHSRASEHDAAAQSCRLASPMLLVSHLPPKQMCHHFCAVRPSIQHCSSGNSAAAAPAPMFLKSNAPRQILPRTRRHAAETGIGHIWNRWQPASVAGRHNRALVPIHARWCAPWRARAGSRAQVDGARSANLAQNLRRRGHKLHTVCVGKPRACKAGSSPELGHQGPSSCVRVRGRHTAGL